MEIDERKVSTKVTKIEPPPYFSDLSHRRSKENFVINTV